MESKAPKRVEFSWLLNRQGVVGRLVQKGTHGFDQTRQRARATRRLLDHHDAFGR